MDLYGMFLKEHIESMKLLKKINQWHLFYLFPM